MTNQYSFLIFSFLLIATLISRLFVAFKPGFEVNQVWKKIKTWWVISLLICACVHLGPFYLSFLLAIVLVYSMDEMLNLMGHGTKTESWGWKVTSVILFSLIQTQYFFFGLNFISLTTAFYFSCWLVFVFSALAGSVSSYVKKIFGLMYLVLGLSAVPALGFKAMESDLQNPMAAIFFLIFITSLNDIFQYLSGKIFKGPKLAPSISPNKTWSGLMGGVIGSGFVSVILTSNFLSMKPIDSFILGIALSLLGIIGDLTISIFKRRAQIKDTGTALAGHGGFLDRLDSLCMTARPSLLSSGELLNEIGR